MRNSGKCQQKQQEDQKMHNKSYHMLFTIYICVLGFQIRCGEGEAASERNLCNPNLLISLYFGKHKYQSSKGRGGGNL